MEYKREKSRAILKNRISQLDTAKLLRGASTKVLRVNASRKSLERENEYEDITASNSKSALRLSNIKNSPTNLLLI